MRQLRQEAKTWTCLPLRQRSRWRPANGHSRAKRQTPRRADDNCHPGGRRRRGYRVNRRNRLPMRFQGSDRREGCLRGQREGEIPSRRHDNSRKRGEMHSLRWREARQPPSPSGACRSARTEMERLAFATASLLAAYGRKDRVVRGGRRLQRDRAGRRRGGDGRCRIAGSGRR